MGAALVTKCKIVDCYGGLTDGRARSRLYEEKSKDLALFAWIIITGKKKMIGNGSGGFHVEAEEHSTARLEVAQTVARWS